MILKEIFDYRRQSQIRAAGIIAEYALFGAAAQIRYAESVATLDADVRTSVAHPDRLDLPAPIYEFCADRGRVPEGEAIQLGP